VRLGRLPAVEQGASNQPDKSKSTAVSRGCGGILTPMKLPYKESTVFGVPLRNGGFGVGVVARTIPGGKILLAYLFGPKLNKVPALDEVIGLRPQDAVQVVRVGDLSLMDSTWPIIGELHSWKRVEWPMPPFARIDDISKRAWQVEYADADVTKIESQAEMHYADARRLDRDSVLGAGAAEITLTRLLDEKPKG
jgi:hypothetical protein